MPYMVKEVADMAGVSVRTLHYYDQIGLLTPNSVNDAGYRLYSDDDLNKLQQVLFFKELDFSLKEIKEILDTPGFDKKKTLIAHKKLLIEKRKRLTKIIESVEKTIDSIQGGVKMDKKDMFNGFDMSDIEKHKKEYAEEAKKKYGQTDAYQESIKKTASYTEDDWASIMEKGNGIFRKLADLMEKGPANSMVQETIAEYRQYISDSYYTCTLDIFRGLGDLYVSDQRFMKNIDKFSPGLAEFIKKAIDYYCDNQKKK